MQSSLKMRWILGFVTIFAVAACTACYTPIKVRRISAIGDQEVDGVPFYFPTQVRRTFALTKLKLADGTYSTRCEQVRGEEFMMIPDYAQLYLIRQHDFFFGQNTFAVTLKDGMLVSVNSVRDPQVDEMLSATASAVKGVAALAAGPARAPAPGATALPDCNDGKRYDPLP